MTGNKHPLGGKLLTDNECELLRHLLLEHDRKTIAKEMHKSEDTIDSQFRTLYLKLGVTKAVGAAVWAVRLGFDENGIHPPANPRPRWKK